MGFKAGVPTFAVKGHAGFFEGTRHQGHVASWGGNFSEPLGFNMRWVV